MKAHKYWGMAAMFCMIMCMYTGFSMVSGKHKNKAED